MTSPMVDRQLRVFADPATPFNVTEAADARVIRMVREGEERHYVVRANGAVTSRHDNREHVSISALLASTDFADIRTLRATQRRVLQERMGRSYMAPEGEIDCGTSCQPLTQERFREAANYRDDANLGILLIDGPAGVGKTSLIERLVFERSDSTFGQPPLLHVTSSGKRLSSLNQELAHATQILRSKITFDQVPVLAQLGVIQVAIDGFDELVDEGGYKDAWSALRDFLAQVARGGPVLLAGRDTFFDQQSFRARIAQRIPNLALATARLQPVSRQAAIDFLSRSGWTKDELTSADSREWFRPGSYQLRPFFLAQLATAGAWSDLRRAHGSPQAFVVARFVRREAEVVARMVIISADDAEAALWEFYGLIVEDMALQESDAVDVGYLALACETAFAGRLNDEDLQKLVHKAGSFGLLESDDRNEMRAFPHSEIQDQFLARATLRSLLVEGHGLPYLRRVAVSMGLAEAFSDAVVGTTESDTAAVVDKLLRVHREQPFADRFVGNAIALLLACLTRPALGRAVEITGGEASAVRVVGVLEPAVLKDISFGQFDARGADLRSIRFERCSVGTLTADSSTIFGATAPSIGAIVLVTETGSLQSVRARELVTEWVARHSQGDDRSGALRDADLPLIRYFDRLCRKFLRQHQIRNGPTDEAYFLIADPLWEEVRPILGNRLIIDGGKEAAGPNDGFLRLRSPEKLLSPPPDDNEARLIRARLTARARQLGAVVLRAGQ